MRQAFLVAGICWVGLTAGCESYRKRQVGLVSAPRPVTYDGQPMTRPVRIEGHASRVVTRLEPAETTGNAAYVARDTFGGGLFGRIGSGELGISIDASRSRGAVAAGPLTIDPVPDEAAYSVVLSVRRSIRVNEQLSIGVAGEFGWLRVPILLDGSERDANAAAIYRAAIIPSWRWDSFTLYGGLHLTNDFVVPAATELDETPDAEAHAGGVVAIATAGAAVSFGNGVKLSTQLAKPFAHDVDHGLQLDIVLGFELGDPAPPAAASAPAAAPAWR